MESALYGKIVDFLKTNEKVVKINTEKKLKSKRKILICL